MAQTIDKLKKTVRQLGRINGEWAAAVFEIGLWSGLLIRAAIRNLMEMPRLQRRIETLIEWVAGT